MRTSRTLIAFLLGSALHAQVAVPVPPVVAHRINVITEDFTNSSHLDVLGTGARWGGGRLLPEVLGGRGVHGDFVASDGRFTGRVNGVDVYEWSTDNQLIPAARTLLGTSVTVTNGVFEFSSFVLPAGQKVVFRGTNPAQIHVQGLVLVGGELDASAPATAVWDGVTVGTGRGQPGGTGGAGGGPGGAGGDRPTVPGGKFDGASGSDVVLAAGHPYAASRNGTGGGGSLGHPPGGNTGLIQYCYALAFSQNLAAGGAGGSLDSLVAGTAGNVVVRNPGCTIGPASLPGATTLQLLPEVNGVLSITQFLVGGSGGGGAGTNPYFSVTAQPPNWKTGAAGAGGGGAIQLGAGGGIAVFPGGVLAARGGSPANTKKDGYAGPGGGGSGGSILLQALRFLQAGSIDLSGGKGGTWIDNNSSPSGFLSSVGGNGGAGYLRLESVPRPAVAALGTVNPPAALANTGLLRDADPASGARSLWYVNGSQQPQQWVRFTIDAVINGQPAVFSDDPAFGQPPGLGTTPVVIFLQGAMVDVRTLQPNPTTLTPWVQQAAGLAPFPTNGVRWVVLLDRSVLGPSVPIEVLRVTVWHQ